MRYHTRSVLNGKIWFVIHFVVFSILLFYSCTKDKNEVYLVTSQDGTRYYDENEMKWKYFLKNIAKDSLLDKITQFNTKGAELRDISNYKEALKLHFEALQLAEEIEDTSGIIVSLNNIGTDLRRTGSNLEASDYHYRALELSKTNDKFLKSNAISMNGLGNIFLALEKNYQAKEYFEKSLQIEKQLGSNLGQAINYANLGTATKNEGNIVQSLQFYNKSLDLNKKIESNIGIAICKNDIGNIFIDQKQNAKGIKLIREALDLVKNSDDVYHKMEMLASLCNALIKNNKNDEAQSILNEISTIAENYNSFDQKQTTFELTTLLKKNQKDFQAAFEAKEKAIAYKDSTTLRNNEVRVLELENRYKNKQAIEQIKTLTNQKDILTKQNQIFLLLSILTLFVLGFLIYRYRIKSRYNSEIKKLNEMKLRFFSNISHELRTPLTLIKGPLENVITANTSQELKPELEIMKRNSDRLLHLVEQILSLSKIDAGKFEIKALKGDLKEELHGIAHSFDYLSLDKKMDFHINLESSGEVWYDREITEIILTNLLSNAFKYAPSNGFVALEGKHMQNHYSISVRNQTDDIHEKNLDVFLERFYSSANKVQQGIGIGLSLVKELCVLYNAKLSISKPEENAIEFTVNFPTNKNNFKVFAESEYQKPLINDKVEISKTEETTELKKFPIILVVEDNEDMRMYIKSIFDNEYKVLTAENGLKGYEKSQELIPDVIISDIMMPEMNGFEMCEKIRTNAITNHIPVLLLTALADENNMIKGLEKEADDYISKPFSSKILKQKVKNLIESRKILIDKYRQEILVKPFDLLLKHNNLPFNNTIKKVLENHITDPDFGVESFCDIAAMSRTQLHRKLIATTGFSTTEFIRIHRIKIAADFLKKVEISISDACYASGFNDTSYFSKQFKLFYGVSPKEFKESIGFSSN